MNADLGNRVVTNREETRPEIKAPMFRFAIIADTHIMPDGGSDTAPYAVLNKANQRARMVVKNLNLHDPEFVIHLGDMVRPFPALSNYDDVCSLALSVFLDISCQVHYLPGNHDIGDKPIACAPAPQVCDAFVGKYKMHFGATFDAFAHQGIQFITLNASVLNSNLSEEADQWMWLEQFTKDHVDERCFVFIHYPPYLTFRDEQPHYDNIDEPGRSRLLELLGFLSVEGLFAGHVHHFFYNRDGQTDMYCLPSTAFTRHDFSELFSIAPGAEFGRNDVEKLGYAMVDVFADTHAVRLINVEEKFTNNTLDAQTIKPLHPREGYVPPIAVQLRHDWSTVLSLPTNGPLDDFTRKKARNDYPILSTWQMGLTWLRVPLDDLDAAVSRDRMGILNGMGQRFIVVAFGIPCDQALEKLLAHALLIDALEVVLSPDDMARSAGSIETLRRRLKKPIYVGPLVTTAQENGVKGKFFVHKTSFGFRANGLADPDHLSKAQKDIINNADGLLFQIHSDEDVLSQVAAIDAVALKLNKLVLIHVATSQAQPARGQFDPIHLANRTALACLGAYSISKGLVVLDTLMDIDRGDFPRGGLIDRRGNLNLSGRYLKSLLAFLEPRRLQYPLVIGETSTTQTHTLVRFERNGRPFCLCLNQKIDNSKIKTITQELGKIQDCFDLQNGTFVDTDINESSSAGLLLAL
jgi:hypothetical protein